MTVTDDLKSALSAYLDANEARLESIETQLAALTPVSDPPAQDTPPVETPAGDSQNPSASDPVDENPPPPAIHDLVVLTTVPGPKEPSLHPGTGNTVVLIKDGTIPSYWKQAAINDPDTNAAQFSNSHAGSARIVLDGVVALFCWNGIANPPVQLWPADPLTLPDRFLGWIPNATTPSSHSTPTPPASTVSFPVSPGLDAAAPINPADMSVTLTFADGTTRSYSGAQAIDRGNWTPDGFSYTQRNFELWDAANNYRVFFRPDATSGRWETVHEFCSPGLSSVPAAMSAHSVEVFSKGVSLGKKNVPLHHFNTRWRFQSSLRILRTDFDALKAAKRLPPYGRTPFTRAIPPPAKPYVDPLDTSNITLYMPMTGERGDIGLDNEYEAAAIATGDVTMVNSLVAWAEAAASMPYHARDPKTGRYINWADYPKSSWYDGGTFDPVKLALGSTSPVTLAANHYPSLSYTIYVLTGDLFHLENLQACCVWAVAGYPGFRDHFRSDESRTYAWVLRAAADAVVVSPDAPSSASLLPKSYFKAMLDHNQEWFMTNYVNNPGVKTSVFFSGVDAARAPFWEEDYLGIVLSWVAYRGFDDWQPIANWKAANAIARCDGQSGWPRTTPIIYYAKPDDWRKTPPPSTWADLATLNGVTLTADGQLAAGLNQDYLGDLRGHLELAKAWGNNAAVEPLAWLESGMVARGYKIPWRTSFAA